MATEKFNYEGIKSSFEMLNGIFEAFASCLENLNNTIQENINVGAGSGILGSYGTSIINLWNNNASTFGDFYKNFDSWSATVVSLASSNSGFEGLTADMFANYQSHGGTLDGVANLRLSTAVLQGATKVDGKDIYDENNSMTIKEIDPTTGEEIEVTYVRTVDQYGNAVVKKYDKDGNLLEIKLVTANGQNPALTDNADGTYTYVFQDERGNNVTFIYDKDGNIIEEYAIDENGVEYCITHTDENGNYDPNVNDRYIYDGTDWVIDSNQIAEECAAYIDSVSNNGTIDFSKVDMADIDALRPEVKEMVIESITDKFLNNCQYEEVSFDPNFGELPIEIQNNIIDTIENNAKEMASKFIDGKTPEDLDAYEAMSLAEKTAVDGKLKENFDANISSNDPLEWKDEDWELYNNLSNSAVENVAADLGYTRIYRTPSGHSDPFTQVGESNGDLTTKFDSGKVQHYDAATGTTDTAYANGFHEISNSSGTTYEVNDIGSVDLYDHAIEELKVNEGNIYYANNQDTYVNNLKKMQTGDYLVISCSKLQVDINSAGLNGDLTSGIDIFPGNKNLLISSNSNGTMTVYYVDGQYEVPADQVSKMYEEQSLNQCEW